MREEVGLVLHRIDGSQERPPVCALLDAAVVPGDDAIERVSDRLEEGSKLDALIAEDVGARRAASAKLIERVADDAVEVLALERHDLERHAEAIADLPREGEILLPRAAPQEGEIILEPDL